MKHIPSALALSAAIFFSPSPPADADTYSVLWNFGSKSLGQPFGRLDIDGSLFGMGSGYNSGYGQVFELTGTNGAWNLKSIAKFDFADGANPYGGLIQDASGALYGTTQYGDAYTYGNVFKLSQSGKSWKRSTLWAFGAGGGGDGQNPNCDLVMDGAGNVYGTTYEGGVYDGFGTAFELSFVNGAWAETILHSFGNGSDGLAPYAGLLLDKSGALYGTTLYGGANGVGTVFELTNSGGVWTETLLYNFAGQAYSDGAYPFGILREDSSGNLYGTTYGGGISGCSGYGCGTVFELSQSGGVWTEHVLYEFTGGKDGAAPLAGLQPGNNYNTLYGTTTGDNGAAGSGTAFKLSKSGGVWKETTIHAFGSIRHDGKSPGGQIVRDSSGNLYGTTELGGTHNSGIVWEITP